MMCSVLLLFFAVFATSTQARSLPSADSRQSEAFKAFEAKLLQKLGLKRAPRFRRDAVVPQYMLDLYHSRVRDDDYISSNLVFRDFATTANIVRSFHHTDAPQRGTGVNRSKRLVHLDIASVPSHEELVKAEFRIFNNRSNAVLSLGKHIINIYQIIAPGVRKLLDSRAVNVSSVGWQSYDILEAVKHWHQTPGENNGLEVDIIAENGLPADISHLHFDKPLGMEEQQWLAHHRPLLALYSRDPTTHYHKRRERRSTHTYSSYKGLCKRFDLKVHFRKQLNWSWVIQPKLYNAYMCHGKCKYPLVDHMNATNHAIVQTLVSSEKKYKGKVPPACCVPTELDSTTLLYFSDNTAGSVEIKDFPEMVVVGCGCR